VGRPLVTRAALFAVAAVLASGCGRSQAADLAHEVHRVVSVLPRGARRLSSGGSADSFGESFALGSPVDVARRDVASGIGRLRGAFSRGHYDVNHFTVTFRDVGCDGLFEVAVALQPRAHGTVVDLQGHCED
jgi:hypothetical protein